MRYGREDQRKEAVFMRHVLIAIGRGRCVDSDYPNKPIQLVIPNARRGGVNLTGRAPAKRLAERLRQPVMVVSRPGVNGNIAAELVAKSAPDGNTMLFGGDYTASIRRSTPRSHATR